MSTKFSDEILATEGVVKNADDMPLSWATQYLRAYLNRKDLASVVATLEQGDFDLHIEKVRNFISLERYKEASSLLHNLTPRTPLEHGEYAIERCRLLHKDGNYQESIELCDKTLGQYELGPVSKMTLLQIKGVSQIQQQNYDQALLILQDVAAHASLFPYSHSIVCSIAYLVWLHCHFQDQIPAQNSLLQLQQQLDAIKHNESIWISRLLFFVRAKFHYEKTFGLTTSSNELLIDSLFLSEWLGDKGTVKKATIEIQQKSLMPTSPSKWYWIQTQKIILWKNTTIFSNLTKTPLLCKIIEVLKEGPRPLEALFEQIWNLKYEARHEKTLRATLSKLRKLLPPNTLLVKEGVVYFD